MKLERRAEIQFDIFNQTYFDGQLPEVEIRCVKDLRNTGGHRNRLLGATSKEEKGFIIELEMNMPPALNKITLMHEMLHVKVWPKSHRSELWKAEVMRVAKMGFLLEVI